MNFILGATLIVVAMIILHLGRLVVQHMEAARPARERLVADIFAVIFTAVFSGGLMVLFNELTVSADPLRLAALVVSLVGAFVGAKLVAAAFRRAAVRSLPVAAPH